MQKLKPGDLVHVRSARWRIADIRSYDACQIVTLSAVGAGACRERRVIAPFDVIDAIGETRRPRLVGPRRWRRMCRHLLTSNTPPGGLWCGCRARMDILPHQLEPALALLRGLGSRILLADDVGLGKTMQAALAVAELHTRGWIERVLILTPAGVREQWAQELEQRLDIAAPILDAADVRKRCAALPVGVNPWTTVPIAVASLDYVKRPDVLPAVACCPWDVVVIDEAHNAVGDTDRFRAAASLSARASFVLLLTATPHSGHRRAFTSLCGMGALGSEQLLIFRRTRRDVGLAIRRRVHRLFVRSSPAEQVVQALLTRFTHAVRKEHGDRGALELAVLHKRALSSARSLERSIERRLATLQGDESGASSSQLLLPLDDREGEWSSADDVPTWSVELSLSDAVRERRMLNALKEAAHDAAARETKLATLRRLLRRISEPAIVFTEYRDTLFHLRDSLDRNTALLHGGLGRTERATALADFRSGRSVILLATDAAGEGLNLHQNCRLVVNLELPWNPMRLEQRIGRVDRIGQQRTVHAVHLIARDTGEPRILDRLRGRMALARADMDVPDPIGDEEERAVAAFIVGAAAGDQTVPESVPEPPAIVFPRLTHQATGEATRLTEIRPFVECSSAPRKADPLMLRSRRCSTRKRLGRHALLVILAGYEDRDGRLAESLLIPLAVHASSLSMRLLLNATLLGRLEKELLPQIEPALAAWREEVQVMVDAFTSMRVSRERAIAAETGGRIPESSQAGLFDRRTDAARAIELERRRETDRAQQTRLESVERAAALTYCVPRVVLAIAP